MRASDPDAVINIAHVALNKCREGHYRRGNYSNVGGLVASQANRRLNSLE
jgi:hypothetical protein